MSDPASAPRRLVAWRGWLTQRRWRRVMPGLFGLLVFGAVGLLGLVVPVDHWPVGPREDWLLGPSLVHPLGTDWLGRDLLLRILVATRAFFLPGIVAILVCGLIGVSLGAFAGFSPPQDALQPPSTGRRRLLAVLQGGVSIGLALPSALPRMVSLVLLCAMFGFSPYVLAIGAGVIYAGELAEDVRRRVQACCREEYIEAAAAGGIPSWRILGYHIIWLHTRPLVLRHLMQLWALVILVETSLSFMPDEFGVQEPNPSWGNILKGTRDAALAGNLWAASVVTAVIVGTIVLLAWLGDVFGAERDAGGRP